MPPINIPNPIMQIQATGGRNSTKSTPTPNPIRIPAITFLNLHQNILLPPIQSCLYIILNNNQLCENQKNMFSKHAL